MEEHGTVTKHIAEESLSFEIPACVLFVYSGATNASPPRGMSEMGL